MFAASLRLEQIMIGKILVPVDGSAFAECALPLALALSEKTGAELRLAMVNEPLDITPGPWAEAFLSNHMEYLDSITRSMAHRVAPTTRLSSTLLEGEVAQALCAEAIASDVDLIIISTHGHGGLTRMWLGSVADAVLRESNIPVMLVRPRETETETDGLVSPETIKHVVIPLDGSAFGEAALKPALEFGDRFGASYTLLRTVAYPSMISPYLPDTVQHNALLMKQLEEDAWAYLETIRKEVDDGSRQVDARVLVNKGPASGVLEYVAASGADFVAMASHSRHGIARFTLGSVADKVIRGSHTPVLIVHPQRVEGTASSEEVA